MIVTDVVENLNVGALTATGALQQGPNSRWTLAAKIAKHERVFAAVLLNAGDHLHTSLCCYIRSLRGRDLVDQRWISHRVHLPERDRGGLIATEAG